ncbi:MAG: hypothetical protein QN178_00810 [Armatimonadota bacterium]|nr:hypothetical protein [Armatimonadota bacterium]
MSRKPFEIVAECEMAGFPSGADIERLMARLDQARSGQPDVVKATVTPPAVYRDGRYVLDARFLVWADDATGATNAVEEVLRAAEVTCRFVTPSGRALAESEVPKPRASRAAAAKSARPSVPKKAARPKAAAKRGKPAKTTRAPARSKRAAKTRRPAAGKRRSR